MEKTVLNNFVVRPRWRNLTKASDDIEKDMIAARDAGIQENPMQNWVRGEYNIAFFGDFTGESRHQRLADLDSSAGEVPARHVAVPDQEYSILFIDHKGLHSQ